MLFENSGSKEVVLKWNLQKGLCSIKYLNIVKAYGINHEPRNEPALKAPRPSCHLNRQKLCTTHQLCCIAGRLCGRGFLLASLRYPGHGVRFLVFFGCFHLLLPIFFSHTQDTGTMKTRSPFHCNNRGGITKGERCTYTLVRSCGTKAGAPHLEVNFSASGGFHNI